MAEKRFRWYLIVWIAGGGAAYFLYEVLSGDPVDDAAISTVIFVGILSLTVLFLLRRRRKTLLRLAEQGQVECYIRRPEAPEGDRYRKWNIGLVKPSQGLLTFQPVLGRTSIARGEPFDMRVKAMAGPRFPATKWDKFNSLAPYVDVMPLQSDEGLVEVAGQAPMLDRIETSLAGTEPRDARSS
jgi:hypothetical protein